MMTLRPAAERGHAHHGWLNAKHTFSFANYYDEDHLGFRDLVVINEDKIQGGAGFPTHGHENMEIITYVIDGALEHKDSMGNSAIIRPGEVQRMSAGTGVRHSEFNHLKGQETHLYQIWILPSRKDIAPSYAQKSFLNETRNQKLVLAVSGDGREGSLSMNQDVDLYLGNLSGGQSLDFVLRPDRHAWIQVVRGEMKVAGQPLRMSDGLAVSHESRLQIDAQTTTEFLLFDLP